MPDGRRGSWEEHPPAMTNEGGKNADTALVPLSEQHSQGGSYSAGSQAAAKKGTDQINIHTPKK